MHQIFYDDSGIMRIEGEFTPHINLENINDEYIYQIDYISNLLEFTYYEDNVEHELDSRTVERYWRISRNEDDWSAWLPLESGENFSCNFNVSPKKQHFVQIKWVRTGTKVDGRITLNSFDLTGNWQRQITDGTAVIKMDEVGQSFFLKAEEVYKVFNISGYQLITTGITPNRNIDVQYRFSQDSGRTWTVWEPLTTANITTVKFSPIRFFEIEYKITRIGTDVDGDIRIYGLNLEGEFQNVSKDYFKTNLMGIRECCPSCSNIPLTADACACLEAGGILNGNVAGGDQNLELNDNCTLPDSYNAPLTDSEKANLFKPYELDKAVTFYNSVSNSTNEVFGHEVTYFVTAPDTNGIDHSFHEYQLYNVICDENIKVSVDKNQFPDNQVTFNQFDLSLFETFEIHITKDSFKQAFGVDKRPSKEDFLFFCNLNRMFQVEHAQPFKDFNNSAVYYKVILKKYNKKASVKAGDTTIGDRIAQLTKNSTLDELMGAEQLQDKQKVANKDEHRTLSQDVIRYSFNASIVKELIDNASIVINKYSYDLSSVEYGEEAIRYKKVDKQVKVSDNRAYMAWFRVNNYAENETYNFITNYDIDNNNGYILDLVNGEFAFTFNTTSYTMPVANLSDGVWYCYLINVDQRQRKVSQYLYKRNVEDDEQYKASRLHNSDLKLVTSQTETFVIDEFEFNRDIDIIINASDMSLTNIRLFNDVIPEDKHNKVLNQNIIRDSHFLILADNSNKRVDLPNVHPYN